MIRFLLAALFAVVTFASANAATPQGTLLSADKRITAVPFATGKYLPDAANLQSLGIDAKSLVAGNIGTLYPKGEYFCCYGYTISGPTSPVGEEIALAVAFTPTTTKTLAAIQVGVGYVEGTNAIAVSLFSDAGGLPGTSLASLNVANLPTFGSCCALATASSSGGVTLTAGTQYWVVVSTPVKNTYAAWNFNTTDEVDEQTLAVNEGSGWLPSGALPGLAFAVYGQ